MSMEDRKREEDDVDDGGGDNDEDGNDEEEEQVAWEVEEPLAQDSRGDVEVSVAHANAGSGAKRRRTLWVILATTATLIGRRVLTTGFRAFFFFSVSPFLPLPS